MRELLDVTMVNVRYVSIRTIAGTPRREALTVQTKHGSLTLVLIPDRGTDTVRVIDYRERDRKRQKNTGIRPLDAR